MSWQNGDPQFVGSIGMVLVELQYPAKGIQNPIDFNSLLAYLQKRHPGWSFVLKASALDVDFFGYIPPLPDASCTEEPGSQLTLESNPNPAYQPPTKPVLLFKVFYHCITSPGKPPDEVKTVCTDVNTYFLQQYKVLQYPDIKEMNYYSN